MFRIGAVLIAALAMNVAAAELRVPSQYPTIKAAIAAAQTGDSVLIADGVYTGAGNVGLFFGGKTITVRSENGAAGCVIDGAHTAVIVTFNAGEGPGSVLQGLTLRRGNGVEGGGVKCSGASPTIRACVFDTCWGSYHSSGVGCIAGSSPRIEDCTFADGLAGVGGAVHALGGSHPKLIGCIIRGHRTDLFGAGGVGCDATGSLTIDRCTFEGNQAIGFSPYGAGVFVNGGIATITNSLFVNNSAGASGGAIACANGGSVTVVNCTFSGNISASGGAVWSQNASLVVANSVLWGNSPDEIVATGGLPQVRYSVVMGGWAGPGNQSADPLFVNAGGGDYRLSPGSACIDAGDSPALAPALTLDLGGLARRVDDPATPDTGVGPAPVIDIGAHEFQPESCYPDCSGEGALSVADFGCFQGKYVLGDLYADCNASGGLSVADFGCFQGKYVLGCP